MGACVGSVMNISTESEINKPSLNSVKTEKWRLSSSSLNMAEFDLIWLYTGTCIWYQSVWQRQSNISPSVSFSFLRPFSYCGQSYIKTLIERGWCMLWSILYKSTFAPNRLQMTNYHLIRVDSRKSKIRLFWNINQKKKKKNLSLFQFWLLQAKIF